jgi:hypothetical protein
MIIMKKFIIDFFFAYLLIIRIIMEPLFKALN